MKQIYQEGPDTTSEHGQATADLAIKLEHLLFDESRDPLLATGSLLTAILSIVDACPEERREEFKEMVRHSLDIGLRLQTERPGARIIAALDSHASR